MSVNRSSALVEKSGRHPSAVEAAPNYRAPRKGRAHHKRPARRRAVRNGRAGSSRGANPEPAAVRVDSRARSRRLQLGAAGFGTSAPAASA